MFASTTISCSNGLTNRVPVPLTKNSTYKDIVDLIKLQTNDFTIPDSLILSRINDEVNAQYRNSDKKFYVQSARLCLVGFSNPFRVSLAMLNPFPKKVLNVTYLGYNRVNAIQLDNNELEQASQLTTTNGSSVYWADQGDSLEVYLGSNVTVINRSSVLVTYIRQPITDVTLLDYSVRYPDVLDYSIDSIVERLN